MEFEEISTQISISKIVLGVDFIECLGN